MSEKRFSRLKDMGVQMEIKQRIFTNILEWDIKWKGVMCKFFKIGPVILKIQGVKVEVSQRTFVKKSKWVFI